MQVFSDTIYKRGLKFWQIYESFNWDFLFMVSIKEEIAALKNAHHHSRVSLLHARQTCPSEFTRVTPFIHSWMKYDDYDDGDNVNDDNKK